MLWGKKAEKNLMQLSSIKYIKQVMKEHFKIFPCFVLKDCLFFVVVVAAFQENSI